MLFNSVWIPTIKVFFQHKTWEKIYHKNIIIDYESGLYNMYQKEEKVSIFRFYLNESAMYFLIIPYDTKKQRYHRYYRSYLS